MSEIIPQNGDAHFSNPGPEDAEPISTGPLPVLSNARISGQCRVLHCPVDLNTQTNTNRKYYLCREHWASERILVDGIPQRFCGQCSRFKILTEFDGFKRTCRQCLFLRNTKKRSQRQENLHRAAYRSPLPPYQLDPRGKFAAPAATVTAAAPVQTSGLLNNAMFYNNHHTSQQVHLLRQQLQQIHGLQLVSRTSQPPAQPAQPPQLSNPILSLNERTYSEPAGSIDVENLNTILNLINSIGVLGDGHTGNSEADALYYLFQELQTLKNEIESKGHTVASMHARKRKLAAEQELARANLEVADIEEQLIRVSMLNKQRQQIETEHRLLQNYKTASMTNNTDETAAATTVLFEAAHTIPITITTSPLHDSINNADHGSDDLSHHEEEGGGGERGKVSSVEMLVPPAPEREHQLIRRSSSG